MTIHRVLRVQNGDAPNPGHKTNRPVLCPLLDEEVLQWICNCEELRTPIVTGPTIREKMGTIRERMLIAASPSTAKMLSSLPSSNGWLCGFQKRHRLTSKCIHGEAASAKTASIEDGRVVLRDITNGYAQRGVLNMDETAYFCCIASNKSISTKYFSDRKDLKKGMTVAVACNADGRYVFDIDEENMEREIEALRHVDVLEAMRWAKDAWEAVAKTTITNCWRHTGILNNGIYELVERVDNI